MIPLCLRRRDDVAAEPTDWTPAQAAVLAHERGGLLVLGGAGTGKTTLAVAAAANRLAAGGQALVVAVNRQAASRVRDRVTALSGRTSLQPAVMTIHALCRGIVARHTDELGAEPRLLTAPEQEFRIREILRGRGASAWPESLAQAYATGGFARHVRAALARVRHLGLDPDEVSAAGQRAGRAEWVALGAFMAEYHDVLGAEHAIDYAELVHRARLLVERPEVVAQVRSGFDAIWIDDLAELDPAQLALVRAVATDDLPVIGLADPDSAIFRFRGAHPRAAAEFRRLFAASVVTLPDSFRLGEPVARALGRVAGRLPAPIAGAEGYRQMIGRGEGTVSVRTYPSEARQASAIAAMLREASIDDGLAWSDMAVLVRSGRQQIPPLVRALIHAGVPVEVAGDEIGLGSDPAVRPLLVALRVAESGQCDADQATALLTSGWGGFDAVEMRVLRRCFVAEGSGVSSLERLAQALAGALPLPEPASEPAAELLERLGQRVALLGRARALIEAGERPEAALWVLWHQTPWPSLLRAEALGSADGARAADRDLDAVVALFTVAADSPVGGGAAGVRAFLAEVAGRQLPADWERESAVRGEGVRVLTAHRARGRQWPFVVVAGVQEGVWPNVRGRSFVLDPEELTSSGLGAPMATRDLVATERRLFHLAGTRAAKRLVVTAVSGTEGEADQPSRFLGELGEPLVAEQQPSARLTTLRALVADLRAVSEDGSADPELRQAAAERLAKLAEERDDRGRPLVPEADPGRWWGVREATTWVGAETGAIRLSPSRLSSLLTCPRRAFLTDRARVSEPPSASAWLGSVIHSLAEHAARDGFDLAHARQQLDEVWHALPFAAAYLSASERVEAEAAIERFLAWQEAHAGATVVGVEVPFRFEVEVDGVPVTVVGTADRVEQEASGALRLIDFKSTRHPPTKKDVETHDQLGLYQLAAELGAFDAVAPGASGSGGGALVFLRVDDKGLPKVLGQPPLHETPHLTDDPSELAHPTWVHHRLAQAVTILREGRFDATPGDHCRWCTFASSCPATAEGRQVIA